MMATAMEYLRLLQEAESLCDEIWDIVSNWECFARETVEQQLVRSTDSIGANIAESYGRYNFGEKIQFLYYSRGSLFETKYWLRRASRRSLISQEQLTDFAGRLDQLAKQINTFLKSLRAQRKNGENRKYHAKPPISNLQSPISNLGKNPNRRGDRLAGEPQH